MKILFLGTPEIASYCLERIIESGEEIAGVVTAVDKPAGRGRKVKFSSVKNLAIEKNLPLFQPENLKSEKFLQDIRNLNPDLAVVVAFRMLPKVLWSIPKFGTINLHASLLPDYRGAAPINWVIINGEKQTGVTTFFIDDKIDTGKIILQQTIDISDTETAGDLHDKIMTKGAELLVKTIKEIAADSYQVVSQEVLSKGKVLNPAPKLNKDIARISWNCPAIKVYNLIRGMSPVPAAWTIFQTDKYQLQVKIYYSSYIIENHSFNLGEIIVRNKKMYVAVKDGFIVPEQIKPQGKKVMTNQAFLNGYLKDNARFV